MIVVLLVMSILLLIAVTSHLGARDRANDTRAPANVRAIPAINSYFADNGTYVGMTLAGLRSTYDASIDPASYSFGDSSNLTETSFCVQSTSADKTWRKNGPSAPIESGACP